MWSRGSSRFPCEIWFCQKKSRNSYCSRWCWLEFRKHFFRNSAVFQNQYVWKDDDNNKKSVKNLVYSVTFCSILMHCVMYAGLECVTHYYSWKVAESRGNRLWLSSCIRTTTEFDSSFNSFSFALSAVYFCLFVYLLATWWYFDWILCSNGVYSLQKSKIKNFHLTHTLFQRQYNKWKCLSSEIIYEKASTMKILMKFYDIATIRKCFNSNKFWSIKWIFWFV